MTIRDHLSRAKQKVKKHLGASSDNSAVAWAGLKTLLRVVESSLDVFPPLKSAVIGLDKCVDVFESASKGQKEYLELRRKLNSLLGDLSEHIGNTTNTNISTVMRNLCFGLCEELAFVQAKDTRGEVRRHAEALDDAAEIMECYRRISGYLERLSLNANLSMWNTLNKLEMEARLQKLCPTMSAVYNSAESEDIQRRACTPGTREEEILKLMDWAADHKFSEKAESVYWMNGMAGTGKTTIAYSLCAKLESLAKLGASFFCSRQIPECRNVKLIIPSIAYQLARFSHRFCCALIKVLEADPDLPTRGLKAQFENLLVRPLREVEDTLPADFIVVIDALDECEPSNSVGQILDVVLSSSSVSSLPIRFLLSSRPEPQIYSRMTGRFNTDHNTQLVLHELDVTKVKYDIETFLKSELGDLDLAPSQLAALVSHSGVLFIYASTAARYIKGGLPFRQHATRLNMILGLMPPSQNGKDRDIDTLYTSILKTAFENRDLDRSDQNLMKTMLDTVICAQEPLTVAGLAGLLRVQDVYQVTGLLGPLRSVLNIALEGGFVTTLHASFPEFMRDHERSATFHCDSQKVHARIAHACFMIIRTNSEQFNICTLESSHPRDREVSNITERSDRAISAHLFYACRYWAAHLDLGDEGDPAHEWIYEFLSNRLLLWMEVLNLKECMQLGPRILQVAASWSSVHKCSKEIIDLVNDAWRFVTMFTSHTISQSTPHIYVSMLPFWPNSAPITKHYTKRMRGPIQIHGSAMTRRQLALLATWPLPDSVWSINLSRDESIIACAVGCSVYIIDGVTGRLALGPLEHGDRVQDVAFSADGTLLVSCSSDRTVKIWDTNNGQLLFEPNTGHRDWVNSVCFSPEGKAVASGSRDGTIRIWDAESGRTVLGPLEGHRSGVWSICFSPDGALLASGSADKSTRVWDTRNGQMLYEPLWGHSGTVRSVVFSPDSTCIASGSDDSTIRVWSNILGPVHVDVLQGHTRPVESVAYSPDGRYIVSGSLDQTIRLWNVEGKPQLAKQFNGHTNAVWCVRFSANGTRIISSSGDETIRLWDPQSPIPLENPLEGHTQAVTSVMFSYDDTRIASGSNDGSICMWDAQYGRLAIGPMKGHGDWVNAIDFSPDGSRIASSSNDNTVRLWNADNGHAMGVPLHGHTLKVLAVCFSPDGRLLASGSADSAIRLWNAQSGALIGNPLQAHTSWVRSVFFSPDCMKLVSGSDDETILVWDVNAMKTVLTPLRGHTDQVWAVYVSPDGKYIASGSQDSTVRVWDASSGRSILGPFLGHTSRVLSVSITPNSSYIASSSDDKTIRLWDAQSGNQVGDPLVGHTDPVCSVSFSSSGRLVVSGSYDMAIRVWDVGELVEANGSQGIPVSHYPPRLLNNPRYRMGDTSKVARRSQGYQSWTLQDDGWVVDSQSRPLAWVPPDIRASVINPRSSLLISTKGSIQLDFDSARLGEAWTKCYVP